MDTAKDEFLKEFALEALVNNRISGLPVIDDDWNLVGVVSDYVLLAIDSISDGQRFLLTFDCMPRVYGSPVTVRNCRTRYNWFLLIYQIQLVPIDLQNRPSWYKEKVYPPNKVPSLEHNNEVRGESLDLIKYIDIHFEGPSVFPNNDEASSMVRRSLKIINLEDYGETTANRGHDPSWKRSTGGGNAGREG
ncbi:glutathione S-transferase L2, chloroplastic-like [Gastrolobium bilobum]|uniref:glutathione S-transferase L2, chloroplastic-like n=1 Tax=Gastrolobium bilobum TaxID=150636 RepID=UPI002AB2FE60|nr:glutathione S-transferase L2, chloroplastic-like [Gastrolobium bilobum]